YHFRDLFAQKSPLQNDTYFFGRAPVIATLRDRIQRCENTGVFGLRKSGKTSVLLAAQRAASADGHRFVLVDCQSPTLNTKGWADALLTIATDVRKEAGISASPSSLGDFSESAAAASFERAVVDAYSRGKRLTVLAFDEIEH